MSDTEATWAADMLTALINGRDLSRFRTEPAAVSILRKARKAKERATATSHLRTGGGWRASVSQRVLVDLRKHGKTTAKEIAERLGARMTAVGSALWFHKQRGRARLLPGKKWMPIAQGNAQPLATVVSLDEARKAAAQ